MFENREWRLAILMLVVVLSPDRSDLRLLRTGDGDALLWMRWLRVYAVIALLDYCLIWLIERIGFAHPVVFGAALVLGAATTVYKIVMICAIRGLIARDPRGDKRGPAAVAARRRCRMALVFHHAGGRDNDRLGGRILAWPRRRGVGRGNGNTGDLGRAGDRVAGGTEMDRLLFCHSVRRCRGWHALAALFRRSSTPL